MCNKFYYSYIEVFIRSNILNNRILILRLIISISFGIKPDEVLLKTVIFIKFASYRLEIIIKDGYSLTTNKHRTFFKDYSDRKIINSYSPPLFSVFLSKYSGGTCS